MRRETRKTPANTRNARGRTGNRRRSPVFALVMLVCAIAGCLGIYKIYANVFLVEHKTEPFTESSPHTETAFYNKTRTALTDLTYDSLALLSNNQLMLINGGHALPDGLSGEFANISDYVRTLNTDALLDKAALVMLREMLDYAAVQGYDLFRATEGYRTYEYQQSLYDSAEDKSYVAPPGHSEHQTGLAVDISYDGVNIQNSGQGEWLMDNAHKFGFILRYPEDKETLTGIPYEPWHYRYVGQPHAYFIYKNGLCFEEYIDYLKDNGELSAAFNGVEYTVYYLSGDREIVEIPQDCLYSASQDNTGGVIVTVRMD